MLKRSVIIILIILIFDQLLKFYIKTNFELGHSVPLLGQYFKLFFIENPGMAFGFHFGGKAGKIILTMVRILAAVLIAFILVKSVKKQESKIFIYSLCLILAGALGNIIDSIFYGLIFSESNYFTVAEFLPEKGGYAGFLQGSVVDMLHINLFWPGFLPWIGGKEVFPPIFNIADSSITIGVFMLIIFYNKIFRKKK